MCNTVKVDGVNSILIKEWMHDAAKQEQRSSRQLSMQDAHLLIMLDAQPIQPFFSFP